MTTLGVGNHKLVKAKVDHALLGYINEADIRISTHQLGYEIRQGVMYIFKPRSEAKAKHKSLPTSTGVVKTVVQPKIMSKKIS